MIFNTVYIRMISKNSFTNSSFANISDVKSAAEAKKASFVMNKDRLDSYINQL